MEASLADVRLIVKSANQQFDDLIIHSEPTWTIRRLKAHLTQVYPSNPTVAEQKLIYSGQLLSDDLILKDILRSYKDVETENHIFHLVYTPKMSLTRPKTKLLAQELQQHKPETSTPVASGSTDGIRHRNVASSSSATATPAATTIETSNISNPFAIPQMTAGCPNFGYPNMMQFSYPNQFSNDMISQQQAAVYNWVQQVYSNYMDQCIRMANGTVNAAPMQPNAPSIPMFMPLPQYMPQNMPAPQLATASSETITSSIPSVDINGPSTSRAALSGFDGVHAMPTATAQQQPTVATDTTPVPQAPAPADNVEQPQPRFPNIVQEEQDNRDWLDSFYSITRLIALLALVYFYSSPLRCLVVALIAVGIYLYHIGFFQRRRQQQAVNRNINNNQNINDNNAAVANAEQEPLIPDAPPAAVAGGDAAPTQATNSITSPVTPPEAEPNATSLIAFVRTFVVSFFASLLPETPAL